MTLWSSVRRRPPGLRPEVTSWSRIRVRGLPFQAVSRRFRSAGHTRVLRAVRRCGLGLPRASGGDSLSRRVPGILVWIGNVQRWYAVSCALCAIPR